MSREALFDEDAKCGACGAVGAYSFMGDCLCSACFKKYNSSEDDSMTTSPDAATKRWTDPEWWRTRKATVEAAVERTNQENQVAFEAALPTDDKPIILPPPKMGVPPAFSISWEECEAIAAEFADFHRRAEALESECKAWRTKFGMRRHVGVQGAECILCGRLGPDDQPQWHSAACPIVATDSVKNK